MIEWEQIELTDKISVHVEEWHIRGMDKNLVEYDATCLYDDGELIKVIDIEEDIRMYYKWEILDAVNNWSMCGVDLGDINRFLENN